MNVEAHKYLTVSMYHITEDDDMLFRKNFSKGRGPILGEVHPYGWWLYIDEVNLAELKKFGYSDKLSKLIEFARYERCDTIRIDRDGPIYKLPKHDWR
jgi:hypothetical protein